MTLTQILQKIKSAFYTKSEVDASLSGYLPKSGGAMTGKDISRNVNNSLLKLMGGTSDSQGAQLSLFGKDAPYYTGQFVITAMTDSNNQFNLIGTPNGLLTWRDKNIDVIEEQGYGYIRYSNGIQICWGILHNANGASGTTISYGKPFLSEPCVTCATNAQNTYCYTQSFSGTMETQRTFFTSTVAWVNWQAIGYWK